MTILRTSFVCALAISALHLSGCAVGTMESPGTDTQADGPIAAAIADSTLQEHVETLRKAGFGAPDWSRARVERVAIPTEVAEGGNTTVERAVVPVEKRDVVGEITARAELLYARPAKGEARAAVRALDEAAQALLDDGPETSEEPASTDERSAQACVRPGAYNCSSSSPCCSGGVCVNPGIPHTSRCVPQWSCTYVESRGTNFVCFDDTFNPLAQYYYRRKRVGDRDNRNSLYTSWRSCGVMCPTTQRATTKIFICGQIPRPSSCTGF